MSSPRAIHALDGRRCRTSGSSARAAASQAVTVMAVADVGINVRTVTP